MYYKQPTIGILILNLSYKNRSRFYKVNKHIFLNDDLQNSKLYKIAESEFKKEYRTQLNKLLDSLLYNYKKIFPENILRFYQKFKTQINQRYKDKNLITSMSSYYKDNQDFPKSIINLLTKFKKYCKEHPSYGVFKKILIENLQKYITPILKNPISSNIDDMLDKNLFPEWLEDWIAGQNIFLDLSTLKLFEKRLLVNTIIQLYKNKPEHDSKTINNIIAIDGGFNCLDYVSYKEILDKFPDLKCPVIGIETSPAPFKEFDWLKNIKIFFKYQDPDKNQSITGLRESEFHNLKDRKKFYILKNQEKIYLLEIINRSLPNQIDYRPIHNFSVKEQLTDSEISVEEPKQICVVHKGTINGTVYICPKCNAFLCLRCAKAFKKNNEKCWVCDFEIQIPED